MALSCYTNCSFPQDDPDLQMELLGFENSFFIDQNPSIDPIFQTNLNNPHTKRIKISEENNNSYNYTNSELPILFDQDNTKCYNYTDLELPILLNDEPVDLYLTDLVPEYLPPLNCIQNFNCPFMPVFHTGVKNSNNAKTGVSVQSRAARERRRKITEKTQELGKLIPGANKMNTAEMFGAAYKYVQFLQAQVGVLQFMNTVQDNEEDAQMQHFQLLVLSSYVQQRLYSSETCLVRKQVIYSLQGNDHPEISSNPSLFKELQNLISSFG